MTQFHDMKYFILPIILLSCFSIETTAQNQDEVMNSMYRYHPKEIIKELGIDTVFIHTNVNDTNFIYSIITYDSLGRETKFIDVEYGFEYWMNYYPTRLLKTTRLIDNGTGPVDSLIYNKKGKVKQSFYGTNGKYTINTYRYKKGRLVKDINSSYMYIFTYKKGKRMTNETYSKNGKALQSKKTYEYNKEGNLYKII